MNAKLMIGNHVLSAQSKPMQAYVSSFNRGLINIERHLAEKRAAGEAPSDGLAVLAAANYHYIKGTFPSEMLLGFEPSDRHKRFVEACRTKEQIPMPRHKMVEGDLGLQVHFNPLRALRPAGVARAVDLPINKGILESDFTFKKVPKLEVFYHGIFKGELAGMPFFLFYNLIPFAAGHALLVPDMEANFNQYIEDMERLTLAWEFLAMMADQRIWVGYNSLGAYASVPQYHWQIVCETTEWRPAIAGYIDRVSDGASQLIGWPLMHTMVFRGQRERVLSGAFELIDRLNTLAKDSPNQYAYNIWMRVSQNGRKGDVIVLPRRHQSTQVGMLNGSEGCFTAGMAFFEVGGNVLIPTEEAYEEASETNLLSHFTSLSIPEEII